MGRSNSKEVYPSDETIEEYARFTYLRKSEIRYLFKRLNEEVTGGLITNPQRRFTRDEIEKILPQIQKNPYRDSIYRVFSSRKDGCLGFEDVLDLCSAFSDECPIETRAAWAFLIYDFDDDNQVSLDDLVEAIQRLTGFCEERQIGIDRRSAEQVARMMTPMIDWQSMGDSAQGDNGHCGKFDILLIVPIVEETQQVIAFSPTVALTTPVTE